MRTNLVGAAVALSALASMGAAQETVPESGVTGAPPPLDIFMEVTADATGEPTLSQDEFVLVLGRLLPLQLRLPKATPGRHWWRAANGYEGGAWPGLCYVVLIVRHL